MNNKDVLEKAAEVEQVEKQEYELRPLVATDMGSICKILSAIGIRQLKNCFDADKFKKSKDKDQKVSLEAVGFEVAMDLAGIIIENIPKAETDIQMFLASLTGMKLMEVKNLPFADYGELILRVVTKEDFQDFFGRVMKLFNL